MRRYRCLCSKKRTGFGSSIAVTSRPLASSGVAGQTIFRPGMCANELSGFCEWNGPPEKPPPDGEPDDHRDRRARAVVLLGGHGHEVVPRARDEVRELHLGDGRMPMIAAPVQPPRSPSPKAARR
jgi:hypothetical protein